MHLSLLLALPLAAAPAPGPAGALRGTVIDEVDYLPRQGVTLNLSCECEQAPRSMRSAGDGTFAFEGLSPGRYELVLYGGEGLVEYQYEVAPGQTRELVLAIAPQRLPERDTRNLPVYSSYSRNPQLLAAQLELSFGGVLLVGGFIMIVAAVVEGAKRPCPYGPDTCAAPPRPRVVRGLAYGGGLATATGGVLLGLGAAHRRRYRLGLNASRDGAGLTLAGRF